MNRFHDKLHKDNHLPGRTEGEIDSGYDPLVTEGSPFHGDFFTLDGFVTGDDVYITGDIQLAGDVIAFKTATETRAGVIRFATETEATDAELTSVAITPRDLDRLTGTSVPHDLDSVRHTDLALDGLSDGDIIYRQHGEWINGSPITMPELATDQEVAEGADVEKPISPAQLYTEINRKKPIYASSVALMPVGDPQQLLPGTLCFAAYRDKASWYNNSSFTREQSGLRVYRWTGVDWEYLGGQGS